MKLLRLLIGTFLCVVAAACAQGNMNVAPAGSGLEAERLSHWIVLQPHTTDDIYNGIVPGPGGKVWFAVDGPSNTSGGIAKIDSKGAFTEFPTPGLHPNELIEGADGKMYADVGNLLRMTAAGQYTVISIPSGDCICGDGMTLGKDANVWFLELNHVAKISTSGHITEYVSGLSGAYGGGIAWGPDGRVWYTDYYGGNIDALNPRNGKVSVYTPSQTCYSESIVSGAGVLWFNCPGYPAKIGKITSAGTFTFYTIKTWTFSEPAHSMTMGPDGNLWFAGQATINGNLVNSINRFDVHTAIVTSFILPDTHHMFAWDLTEGPGGNMWLSNHAGTIDVLLQ